VASAMSSGSGTRADSGRPCPGVVPQVTRGAMRAPEELADVRAPRVADRTRAALRDLGEWVDVWEIGNEPNGEWAGSSPKEINAKVAAAHDVVAQAGRPTALTLNYWSSPDCDEPAWADTKLLLPLSPRSWVRN